MVTGEQVIDGRNISSWNGLQLRHVLRQGDGHIYFYDPKGVQAFNGSRLCRSSPRCSAIPMATVTVVAPDMYGITFYFDERLVFKPDKFIRFDGRVHTLPSRYMEIAVNRFAQNPENKAWNYLDSNGYAVLGDSNH